MVFKLHESLPSLFVFIVYNSPNITLMSFHPNKPQSAEAYTPAVAPVRKLLTHSSSGSQAALEPEPTAIQLG